LAGTFVCQSIPTLVGVAFAVAIFEIARGAGFPLPPAVTRPEQPLLKSNMPIANSIRMFVANRRPEISRVFPKPLMILLDLPTSKIKDAIPSSAAGQSPDGRTALSPLSGD
jgi:hypothetical protein